MQSQLFLSLSSAPLFFLSFFFIFLRLLTDRKCHDQPNSATSYLIAVDTDDVLFMFFENQPLANWCAELWATIRRLQLFTAVFLNSSALLQIFCWN